MIFFAVTLSLIYYICVNFTTAIRFNGQ